MALKTNLIEFKRVYICTVQTTKTQMTNRKTKAQIKGPK